MSAGPQSVSGAAAEAQAPLEIRLLGPLEVSRGGEVVALGGPRQGALVALLCLHRARVVSVDEIVDELWGESPPATARHMVEVYVSKLRGLLGPSFLVTRRPGYVLELDPESVDIDRFEGLAADGEEALAERDHQLAASRFAGALGLWRGLALADFTFEPFAQSEIARLEELKLLAEEGRIDAELGLGQAAELVAEIEGLIETAPFRERLRAQLMLALYRAGRQADALEAYRSAREVLVEELGVEPGHGLRDLERAILAQEEWLVDEPCVSPQLKRASRKVVTLLFVEIATRGQGSDFEALQPLEQQQRAAAGEVMAFHGARLEHFPDGTLMGVFGTPAHDDDALRAVRAAVDLRKQGVASRAVVETGELLVGEQRAVSGPAIRSGVLLLAATPAGEILVGPQAHRLTEHAATFRRPLALAGTTTWPLQSVTSDAPIAPLREYGPFVGRNRELAELKNAFARSAREKTPALYVVVGEPGIGKSRLASVLVNELEEDAQVAVGRCVAYGKGITFLPLRDVIRALSGDEETPEALAALVEAAEHPDAISRRLAAAIGVLDDSYPVEEICWAARLFFEALARERPLLILIEDLHWAAPTFLNLLTHVISVAHDAPIFLLCMARPELFEDNPDWGQPDEHTHRLELTGLANEEVAELAMRLDFTALSDERRRGLVDTADGNPLFLEQLIAFALEAGTPESALDLPLSLQSLLAARIDRLGPGERTVLECSSIVGRDFYLGAVTELLPAEALRTAPRHFESLRRRGLVESARSPLSFEDALRFRHALIQEAAYRSLSRERRARLHERLAPWLAERPALGGDETVGYHLEQAYRYKAELNFGEDVTRPLALRAGARLSAAGESALARHDLPAAVNLLARATALQEAGGEPRLDLRVELGAALFHVGQGAKGLAVLDDVLPLATAANEASLEWRARLERNYVLSQLDGRALSNEEGLRQAESAIPALGPDGDKWALARAWLAVTQGRFWVGRHEDALEASEHAVEYARRAGDRRLETGALRVRCMALWSGETPAEEAAERCAEVAANAENKEVLACALQNLAGLRAMQGRFEEARDLVGESLAIYEELGLMVRVAITIGLFRASIHSLGGDLVAAERDQRRAIALLEAGGETAARSTIMASLAGTLYDLGRYSEAEQQADLSVVVAGEDDYDATSRVLVVRAKLFARRDEFDLAEAAIDEVLRQIDATDDIEARGYHRTDKAEVLLLAGKPDEAASCLEQAVAFLEQKGNVVLAGEARAKLKDIRAREAAL
jgi:DNA-binding SARP family transcriptional activator